MRNLERALSLAWASRQLAHLLPRNVVSTALLLVAGLTEMRVAPTEPLGDGAAELALELNKVGSVCLAVCRSYAEILSCAFCANELFWLELL